MHMGINGFDNHWSKLHREIIEKEDRARWNHANGPRGETLRNVGEQTLATTCAAKLRSRPSAAIRFLEEKAGLENCRRPSTRETLYKGVSHDGEGRADYLRQRRKYDVIERNGMPVTETHWYGHGTKDISYVSAHCKKPIIQRSFFRTQGVNTHRDLPGV